MNDSLFLLNILNAKLTDCMVSLNKKHVLPY